MRGGNLQGRKENWGASRGAKRRAWEHSWIDENRWRPISGGPAALVSRRRGRTWRPWLSQPGRLEDDRSPSTVTGIWPMEPSSQQQQQQQGFRLGFRSALQKSKIFRLFLYFYFFCFCFSFFANLNALFVQLSFLFLSVGKTKPIDVTSRLPLGCVSVRAFGWPPCPSASSVHVPNSYPGPGIGWPGLAPSTVNFGCT